jgi:hypothetical protein
MDHAAVSERDHRLMMRLRWAYPNTGHLYSVIIGFIGPPSEERAVVPFRHLAF